MEKRTAHEKADLVVIWVVSGPGRRLDDWLTDKRGEGALLGGRGVAHLGGRQTGDARMHVVIF